MEKTKKFNGTYILSALKGSLLATAVSLIGILFFAFVIKMFGITDEYLRPVNQVIKAVSILLGVFITLKKQNKNGLVLGLAIGLCYTLLAFVVFSVLNGSFCVDKTLLNDCLFGGIMGAICGIVAVNLKRKKQ